MKFKIIELTQNTMCYVVMQACIYICMHDMCEYVYVCMYVRVSVHVCVDCPKCACISEEVVWALLHAEGNYIAKVGANCLYVCMLE